MLSFFAITWDHLNDNAVRFANEIKRLIGRSDQRNAPFISGTDFVLYDFSNPSRAASFFPIHKQEKVDGAVIGTVFDRTSSTFGNLSPIVKTADTSDIRNFSSAEAFSKRWWGRYIAFVHAEGSLRVVTDPTSGIPCYYGKYGDVVIVFSHLEKCDFLDKKRFSINYSFIKRIIAYDKIINGETGLNEIRELAGGHSLTIAKEMSTSPIWDPRQVARYPLDVPDQEAAKLLRETTQHVVRSWAKSRKRVTINLSGGLDSSIILASMAGLSDGLNAVHLEMASDDAPERSYAESMAAHKDTDLIVIRQSPHVSAPAIDAHPATVRPYRQYFMQDYAALMGDRLDDIGDGIFTGQGGDHLFYHTRSPLSFADWMILRGFSPGFLGQMTSAATLSQRSFLSVLRQCLPYYFGKTPDSLMASNMLKHKALINESNIEFADLLDGLPAWTTESASLPPGKFHQVSILMHMFQIRAPLDQYYGRELIHPLISLPLIELCLRIPCFQLALGGRSRGLAREAFESSIPDKVRMRTSKGDATRFYTELIRYNRTLILNALVDGELVRHGIISKDSMQDIFRTDEFQTKNFAGRLSVYYAVEAWLRTWSSHGT